MLMLFYSVLKNFLITHVAETPKVAVEILIFVKRKQ